jgi:hypothetical protein
MLPHLRKHGLRIPMLWINCFARCYRAFTLDSVRQ